MHIHLHTNMTCTHTDLTIRESRDVGVEYGAGQTWSLEVLILGRESKRASWRRWPELSLERRVEPSGEGSWEHLGCYSLVVMREQEGHETEVSDKGSLKGT